MNLFKSKLRRKAERMYADLIYRRCEIRKELNTMKKSDPWAYCLKLLEDDKLRLQANVLDKLLQK